jgi:hypothetical protein
MSESILSYEMAWNEGALIVVLLVGSDGTFDGVHFFDLLLTLK